MSVFDLVADSEIAIDVPVTGRAPTQDPAPFPISAAGVQTAGAAALLLALRRRVR